jgi:phosphomannomutase
VDGEGVLLYGDQLLVLYAQEYLSRKPGASVMSEVKSSQFFYDEVAARGGLPVMWKVGHTNQKQKMREDGIGLAGETSGHIFFEENRGYDDALFAAVKLLNLLSRRTETLTQIRKGFPLYHDSGEIRITLDTAARNKVIAEIQERLSRTGRSFVAIDGIRAPLDQGFWMLRGSQTQPHLTIRVEAARRETLEEGLKELKDQLRLSGVESGELP